MNFVRVFMGIMLLTAVITAAAYAEDITVSVTPGKYSMKNEMSSNLQPDPVVKTGEKCITYRVYNPVDSLPDKANCSAINVKKKGNTVTYDIKCKGGTDQPPFNGKAEYSSNGMEIALTIVMNGEAEGKTVTITSKTRGKRVGACN
ncbi:MAG: DUF3617 domain-containing protein [Thermodesulfobacteriota bacterium]|jgi:hypothetical protein